MSPLEAAVLDSIACFTLFVAGHLGGAWLIERPRYGQIIVRSFVLTVLLFIAAMAVLYHLAGPVAGRTWILAGAVGLLLMACAFVLYIPFVFTVSSSLSIDTLILLALSDDTLPKRAMYDAFCSTRAAHRRLEIMRANGMVTLGEDGRYVLTPKAMRTASFFTAMKHFWKLWPGG